MKKVNKISIVVLITSIFLGVFMSYVALEHNPQGEFCHTLNRGDISRANWMSWGTPCIIKMEHLFISVFMPWFTIPIILTVMILLLLKVKKIIYGLMKKHT